MYTQQMTDKLLHVDPEQGITQLSKAPGAHRAQKVTDATPGASAQRGQTHGVLVPSGPARASQKGHWGSERLVMNALGPALHVEVSGMAQETAKIAALPSTLLQTPKSAHCPPVGPTQSSGRLWAQ